MTTDPKKSVSPGSISELAKSDVDQLLQTGLADFSLRELLGLLISSAGAAERDVYLEKEPSDKPNGFYDRSLQLGLAVDDELIDLFTRRRPLANRFPYNLRCSSTAQCDVSSPIRGRCMNRLNTTFLTSAHRLGRRSHSP